MLEWSAEANEGKESVIRTMDEPDHRLHFDAQRKLVNLLRRDILDEDSYLSQCIVSTHSLTMVDKTSLHEVVYLPEEVDTNDERAPLVSKDEAEAEDFMGNIMAGLGLSASWVYLERAMIVVEGATEHKYIEELYHQVTGSTLVEDGVQVWDSQGCGHIVKTLERLQDSGRARTFVILDSDAKERIYSKDTLEDHLEGMYEVGGSEPELVWVGDKELEDTWEKNDLAQIAEEHWPREDGDDWDETHFQSVDSAEKPSQEIVDLIRRGCAQNIPDCPSVTKPNIGIRMGRLEDAEHPTNIVDIMENIHEHCS
nr:AAA family ATPase [Halobacterium salinarum]